MINTHKTIDGAKVNKSNVTSRLGKNFTEEGASRLSLKGEKDP